MICRSTFFFLLQFYFSFVFSRALFFLILTLYSPASSAFVYEATTKLTQNRFSTDLPYIVCVRVALCAASKPNALLQAKTQTLATSHHPNIRLQIRAYIYNKYCLNIILFNSKRGLGAAKNIRSIFVFMRQLRIIAMYVHPKLNRSISQISLRNGVFAANGFLMNVLHAFTYTFVWRCERKIPNTQNNNELLDDKLTKLCNRVGSHFGVHCRRIMVFIKFYCQQH